MSTFILIVGVIVVVAGTEKVWDADTGPRVTAGIFLTLVGVGLGALAVMTS